MLDGTRYNFIFTVCDHKISVLREIPLRCNLGVLNLKYYKFLLDLTTDYQKRQGKKVNYVIGGVSGISLRGSRSNILVSGVVAQKKVIYVYRRGSNK